MVDTLRTQAEALALLQVGVPGNISAQDLRDCIYSLYTRSTPQFGEIYWTVPVATTLVQNVWAKAAGTTVAGDISAASFDMPSVGTLRHIDDETEEYLISCDFTITAGGNNQTVWVGLSKNGATPALTSQRYRRIGTGADAGMGSTHGLCALAKNDSVELWVMNETSGATVTIQRANLTAIKAT